MAMSSQAYEGSRMHDGGRRLSSVVLPADGESLSSWVDRAAGTSGLIPSWRYEGVRCRVGGPERHWPDTGHGHPSCT
jgi:hypothetical protein